MIDRREFLSLLAAAVSAPVSKSAEPPEILYPANAPISFDIENMDACWTPWVQYIEPGKPVTFEYPFHLRSFGVDTPGKLSDVIWELFVNETPVTETPISMLVQNGRALDVFPTIAIPAGTNLRVELRGEVPDVIFCAQGVMQRPIPVEMCYWEDDEDEDDAGYADSDEDEDY